MGLTNDTRTIDGLEVRSTQLPALRTLALSARLGRVIAPAIDKAGGLSFQSSVTDMMPALADICTRLTEGEIETLACEILAATSVTLDEGKGPRLITLNNRMAIDTVFSGRFKTMLLVLAFALEVNFADFFDGAPDDQTPPSAAPANKSAP